MSNMNTDYEIPVSKNTVDKMMETLIKENERLIKENQTLTEKLNQGEQNQDGETSLNEMDKTIQKYLNL